MCLVFQTKKKYSERIIIYRYIELLIKKQLTRLSLKKRKTINFSIRYIMYYIYIHTGDDPLSIMLLALTNLSPKYGSITIKKKEAIMSKHTNNDKEIDIHYASISPKKRIFASTKLLAENALSKSRKKYNNFNMCMCKEIINIYKTSRLSRMLSEKIM